MAATAVNRVLKTGATAMTQHSTASNRHFHTRFGKFPRGLLSWGLLTGGLGLCSGTTMYALKLLWAGALSTHLVWGGLLVLLLGGGSILTGFVMLAEWQDPFAGDGSLPEVGTFPEEQILCERELADPSEMDYSISDHAPPPSAFRQLQSSRT